MENDTFFHAEAEAEARIRSDRLGSNQRSSGQVHDSTPPAQARLRASLDGNQLRGEEAPLLAGHKHSNHNDDDDHAASANEANTDDDWVGAADFVGLPWWQTPSVIWLLPPFLLFTLAFGGIIVPKLNLILTLICRQYFNNRAMNDPTFQFMPVIFGSDNPQCQTPEVQALVSKFTLYCNLIPGILTAISSPKLGALSDRYGRRRVIAATTCGMLLGEVITILAATYPESVSVNWLLFGYALDGIAGSFIAAMALTHSYATDCTPPAKRNVAFGYFHGSLFTGIALGPILAGYIIKWSGSILTVFYIALGAHLIFILCLLFVIPESLTKKRQLAARQKYRLEMDAHQPPAYLRRLKGTPLYPIATFLIPTSINLFAPLKILSPRGAGSSSAIRMNLILLSAVDTIMFGVAMGSMTVVILYSEITFGWGNLESSKFVSAVNTGRVLMLVIVLPLITRIFRNRRGAAPVADGKRQRNSGSDKLDIALIQIAVFFDMIGYLGYALVRTGPLFLASGVLASFGGIGSPTLQSALTKHVPSDRIGELLGATGLLHALARVVAPTAFNLIYAKTVGTFRQTVFVCLTATFGVAFLLSWGIRPHVHLDETAVKPTQPSEEVEHEEGRFLSTI